MPSAIRVLLASILLIAMFGHAPNTSASSPAQPLSGPDAGPTRASAFLSVPAAAFAPGSRYTAAHEFENHGRYLKYFGNTEPYTFSAPVHLPEGAQVINVKGCFFDDSTVHSAKLEYLKVDYFVTVLLASVESQGNAGFQEVSTSIEKTFKHDSKYYYLLNLTLPISSGTKNNIWGCGATIEYLPPETTEGLLTISATAFHPARDGYNYENKTRLSLFSVSEAGETTGAFMAPVNLPDGASVYGLTILIGENGTNNPGINARVQRGDHSGNYSTLTSLDCQGSAVSTCTTAIAPFSVDNAQYTYWVNILIPATVTGGNKYFVGAELDYTLAPEQHANIISISNVAFNPFFDDLDFENHARWLIHKHGEGGSNDRGVYVAPVNLPDGAIIDGFEACFYDGSATLAGSAHLIRTRMGENFAMASASSSGSAGYSGVTDGSILWNTVDNSQYMYFVYWDLPVATLPVDSGDVVGCGMAIHYSYAVNLPMVIAP